jgi:hypothetical protein
MLSSCFILAVSALTSPQADTVELTAKEAKLIEASRDENQIKSMVNKDTKPNLSYCIMQLFSVGVNSPTPFAGS